MKLWLLFLIIYLTAADVYGAVEDELEKEITEEETQEITDGLMDALDLDDLDHTVRKMLESTNLTFSELVQKLLDGELVLDADLLFEMLQEIFYKEADRQKEIALQLFLLVLAAAVLFQLSQLFDGGQMTNVTFYVVYLMVFALLMQSLSGLTGQVESVLSMSVSFMKVLTPAYYLAITAASGTLTASSYYQIVLLTITLIQNLLLKIGIPGIQIYVVIGVVNYFSEEDILSKMAELVKTVIGWMTKSVTALIVGLQVIQKMIGPAVDMVKRGVVGKTASAIPGLGNIVDSVTEMTIGCAILVRNCLGAAALIVLVVFGLGPVVQVAITTLFYRLIAALVQPVSEKRLIQAIGIMAEGSGMLLRILITAEILFLLTIAIVSTGGVQ